MTRDDLADLTAFAAVAEEAGFTPAARRLGTSQSALSRTVRRLEERLGVRLLTRTTRSVAPTEAGMRLIETLRPALSDIETALTEVQELRDSPTGVIRITTGRHAADTVLWPALERFLPDYPDIKVELTLDPGFVDIVAGRFDAGVRLGEALAQDMVAVRIGPPLRMAIVAKPGYFETRRRPGHPRELTDHRCINMRFKTRGDLYAWEFEKGGESLEVRVTGPLVFNEIDWVRRAALSGFGLACVPEDMVKADVADGRLARVLEDWCPTFPGYHLYYPSRRRHTRAFSLLLEALRYRG